MAESKPNTTLYERVVRWINHCAASTELENVRDALEKGEKAMSVAEGWSEFTKPRPGVSHQFAQAREGLSGIRRSLDAVQNACLDVRALAQIQSAIRVLNQDGVIQTQPDEAHVLLVNYSSGLDVSLARFLHLLTSTHRSFKTLGTSLSICVESSTQKSGGLS
jgi:hypothetical protein